ncbi:MAG: T9SS type A sorting domain-containing protein [Bacteroidales bacterium]|nr:T9SS type A sorting domain-containing protein [Bacteroidales bacterium]
MNKIIVSLQLCLVAMSICAQQNYKMEMMKLEMKKERQPISDEFKSKDTDYSSFKRAKAWNSYPEENTILSDVAEIDMPIIGGRVRSTLVDKDNDIALVAPSGGGLWKFNPDDGSFYESLNDFGSFLSITSIAQNPHNKNEIIIGTGDEKSDHQVVGSGVFKSTDGGKTFQQLASTTPDANTYFKYIRFVKFSPNNANVIYLSAKNRLFKSSDKGESWNEVLKTKTMIRSLDFLENDMVIVSDNYEGVYISNNGDDNTFEQPSDTTLPKFDDKPYDIESVVVASHAADRSICYAFYSTRSGDNVYRSDDNGNTWTQLAKPTFVIKQTEFCLTIGVHPTNPDIVVLGSVGWGYSTDGGTTWQEGAGFEVDFHDVHFHPSDPGIAFLGHDQGIGRVDFSKSVKYTLTDYRNQTIIVEQPEQTDIGKMPGFNTSQIYFGDYYPEEYGDAILFGQQDGGNFAKVNNRNERITAGDGGSAFVNKQDPNKGYISTQNGSIARLVSAINFDKNGRGLNIPDKHKFFITEFSGNNADGAQLYIPQDKTIQRTIDSGYSFTAIDTHNLSKVKLAVENNVNPTVYAIGYEKIDSKYHITLVSINNAAGNDYTTKRQTLLIESSYRYVDRMTIDPNDKNTIYFTFTTGEAFRAKNVNTTPVVESITGDIEDVVFNTVIALKGSPNKLIAGTNIGMFYSLDGGETWALNNKIPYTKITDLKLRESDKRLFIFTYGRGAWAATIKKEDNSQLNDQFSNNQLVMVYPNPAGNEISVKTDITEGVSLAIYDVKGSLVLETNQLSNINVSHLARGTYVLHFMIKDKLVDVAKLELQ